MHEIERNYYIYTTQKKSFPLRICSVNVTKSAQHRIIPGFLMFSVSFTEEILNAKLHFLVQ